jgi:hypothetical protein
MRATRVRQYAASEGHKQVMRVIRQSEASDLEMAYSQVKIMQAVWSGAGSGRQPSLFGPSDDRRRTYMNHTVREGHLSPNAKQQAGGRRLRGRASNKVSPAIST